VVSAVVYVKATYPVYISGHVQFVNKTNQSKIKGLEILAKSGDHHLAQTQVDSLGNYQLTFIPDGYNVFDFYYFGNGFDTTLIKSVKGFDDQLVEWNLTL